MLYAGVDSHTKFSHVTIIDEEGSVLLRKQVESSPQAVKGLLSGCAEPVSAVLEASINWGKMYDWLDEVSESVVLAHPQKVRAIAEARIKTDKISSATLAHLLRADLIPEAYACSSELRSTKRVLRQRMFYVRMQTMVKNRIQALIHQHDLAKPEASDLFGKKGMTWLRGLSLPRPDGSILEEDLDLLCTLREKIASSEKLIRELSGGDEAVGFLRSIPGIGEFFSVLIRYEVADISRFCSAGKFASYTGLVPSTYSSGGRTRHGKITKQGNKYLRWAFIEAVTPAIRVSPQLHSYYLRIKSRKGPKDARVATARKIAQITWHVWTEQRSYELR